jgi:hypothetical protein
MNENRCVMCWAIIPEGRQVCPMCEHGITEKHGAAVTPPLSCFERIRNEVRACIVQIMLQKRLRN